ncbi:VapE domain-containing protein [Massilia sp. W12]|uniref:VapE domain-containing protein n=1 Tax=Massilia sp. W12 TaxID=3126507 RepID=UPI0030CE8C70
MNLEDFARVPPSLASRPQWLLWRFESNPKKPDGKPLKVPYYANGRKRYGTQGTPNDRDQLVTLAEAQAALAKGGKEKYIGLGFAFLPGDGLIGIDIDKCLDPDTGEVSALAQEVLALCPGYTEKSPSGTGLHIFMSGQCQTFKSDKIGLEVFCGRQFFTWTGNYYAGEGCPDISDEALSRLQEHVNAAKKRSAAPAPASAAPYTETDAELLRRIETALPYIASDEHDTWIKIGTAIYHSTAGSERGRALWEYWSSSSSKYRAGDCNAKRWGTFAERAGNKVATPASIFYLAKQGGWRDPRLAHPAKAPSAARPAPPVPVKRAPAPAAKGETAPAPAAQGGEAAAPWQVLLPVPDNAPPPPDAHSTLGKVVQQFEYRRFGASAGLLGYICRFENGKRLPLVFATNGDSQAWRWMMWPEPRPLYQLGPLRGLPVVVLESESIAQRAREHAWALHVDIVSWPGGIESAAKADWQALVGHDVLVWFYDVAAAQRVADIMQAAGVQATAEPETDLSSYIPLDAPAPAPAPPRPKLSAAALVQAAPPPAPAGAPPASTPPPAGARAVRNELRERLLKTQNGGVRACRENVLFILQGDPSLAGLVGHDQFSDMQVLLRDPPWTGSKKGDEWGSNDDFQLGVFMSQFYGMVVGAIGEIEKAVSQAAHEHAFNPVRDYLEDCKNRWDGVPRVERALPTYWGTEDNEYTHLISRLFFTGMIMRVFQPGEKFDYAPVFEGAQGEGKSTALSILGGRWFADTPFQIGAKDGYMAIRGVWLYEVAELEQFNKSEVNAIKAFMSSQKDRYREPFARRTRDYLRVTAFAATTNENAYFKDTTGNRRFWPVEVKQIDLQGLRQDRDALLGEAVHMYLNGTKWYPTREQEKNLIVPQQVAREIQDVWLPIIRDWLDGVSASGDKMPMPARNRVTAADILLDCLKFEVAKLSQHKAETMRIGAIMRQLGWPKERESKNKPGASRDYYYVRPKEDAQTDSQGSGDTGKG